MVYIFNIVKRVNNSCVISQSKCHYLSKPHVFSSMPLQSGIFTINRKFIIGLVSSIITAAMGYGIRLILLHYLEHDVFTDLDNWIASLSYFCSLGAIRFVINECLKENTFLMSYCGGPMGVSNNTAGSGSLPVGSNAAGYNSSMQAPNSSDIGNYSAGSSSIPGTAVPGSTADHSTTGLGSSSGGDASITNDRSKLEHRISKVQDKVQYFGEQLEGAKQDYNEVISKQSEYVTHGKAEEWQREYIEAVSAVKDSETNLSSEIRMHNVLQKKLVNGDYSMSGTSTTTKRRLSDCSMANYGSSTPTNTKRTSDG